MRTDEADRGGHYCPSCQQVWYPAFEEEECPHFPSQVVVQPALRHESAAEKQAREIVERMQFS